MYIQKVVELLKLRPLLSSLTSDIFICIALYIT